MDLVRGMKVFVALAECGSFVAASGTLATSTAAVSRQVAALEGHLGVRLVHRTTRRLSLTEAGQVFHEKAVQILADLDEAEAVIGAQSHRPTGLLRLSAPLSFGVTALGALLPGFCRKYPDLRLDINLSDRVVDLAQDGVDLALRIAQSPGQNLIARRIAPVRMIACASPGYLANHGVPERPSDLTRHVALHYSNVTSGDIWVFHSATGEAETVRISPHVHANSGDLLRHLALQDGGVIVQPFFIVGADLAGGRLVQILPDWTIGNYSLYAVYLSRRFLSAKVRVFIDYLTEETRRTGI